ncbi:hypothetical protein M422DRAFT_170247, partial [Sphaerobolus stellatus SS14]
VIKYLTNNPNFRCKLFSDSTCEAKESGQKKNQGKDGKSQMHLVLAAEVFGKSMDLDLLNHYTLNPTKHGKSVGQNLARLKKTYSDHLKGLGKTGAGLVPENVTPGSEIANKIGMQISNARIMS